MAHGIHQQYQHPQLDQLLTLLHQLQVNVHLQLL